jgi:hypothetical protein
MTSSGETISIKGHPSRKQGIQQTFFLTFFRIEGGEGAGNSLGLNERPSLAFF